VIANPLRNVTVRWLDGWMDMPDWAPPTVDSGRPSAARCWDYLLGRAHNFAVDRQVA
jgi:hypothetical protein